MYLHNVMCCFDSGCPINKSSERVIKLMLMLSHTHIMINPKQRYRWLYECIFKILSSGSTPNELTRVFNSCMVNFLSINTVSSLSHDSSDVTMWPCEGNNGAVCMRPTNYMNYSGVGFNSFPVTVHRLKLGGSNSTYRPLLREWGEVKPLDLRCPMFNLLRGLCPIKSR